LLAQAGDLRVLVDSGHGKEDGDNSQSYYAQGDNYAGGKARIGFDARTAQRRERPVGVVERVIARDRGRGSGRAAGSWSNSQIVARAAWSATPVNALVTRCGQFTRW
jgi:hypothetical protein